MPLNTIQFSVTFEVNVFTYTCEEACHACTHVMHVHMSCMYICLNPVHLVVLICRVLIPLGVGVSFFQDIHLAKRYYDMAVAHNPAAALPANLALIKVHAKLWHEYAHEVDNSL